MASKGLIWIWLGPLAWMAILLLVASGRADGALEREAAEFRSRHGVRLAVDVEGDPRRSIAHPSIHLQCAPTGWTRTERVAQR